MIASVLGTFLAQMMSEASRAPTEEELHAHTDSERRRARRRAVAEGMGDDGRLLMMRNCEGVGW